MSDSENPIIKAALSGADDDWTPPKDDEKAKKEDDEDGEEEDEEDEDLDDLEEVDDDDEEDEGEPEDDDEDDDDEKESYSKRVQKRIDRERELRRNDEARHKREMSQMKKRLDLRDAKDDLRDLESKTDAKLRKLRKKKAEAMDEGETESVVEIDEEILELKADLKVEQAKVKKLSETVDVVDDDEEESVPPAGREWLSKYPEFHTNNQFKQVVLAADRMVAARGLDKNTDKYYAEIEKIVAPQFPQIVKKRTAKITNKGKKRSAVGGTQKPGTRKQSRKRGNRIRLTKADQEQMRNFGLDPKNPVHAKEWAANKGD